MGLSDTYEHYIDEMGNKYFPEYYSNLGNFIRQYQTTDGRCVDASSGEPFISGMIEMGFIPFEYGDHVFFSVSDNIDKFKIRVDSYQNWEGFNIVITYHYINLLEKSVTIKRVELD